MSGGRARAFSLTLLMVSSLFVVFPITTEATVISSDTTWSGNMTIDNNVLISPSRTLTISPGTNITVTGDYLITVDGSVVIDGRETEPVQITNNNNQIGLNSNTGWWDGFLVSSSGNIDVSWLFISRGRNMFDISGSADISNTSIEHAYTGINSVGSATLNDVSCSNIDISCLNVQSSGVINAQNLVNSNSSYGVKNSGLLNINGLQVSNSGIGIATYTGSSGSGQNLVIDNSSIAVLARGSSSFNFNNLQIYDTTLFLDSISSDGLQITNVVGNNVNQLILGTNIADMFLDNLDINGVNSNDWAIIVDNVGSFVLDNSNFNNYGKGIRLSGSGIHTISNSQMTLSGPIFEVSGTGVIHTISSSFTTTSEFGHLSGVNSFWENSNISGTDSNGLELVSGKHVFNNSILQRNYLYSDSTSFGLGVTWSTVESNSLTLIGWSDGIKCRIDCVVAGSSLTSHLGGVASGSGISIEGGSVELSSLITGNSLNGVHLELGDLHIDNWVGSSHSGPTLLVDADNTAIVRNFPSTSSNSLWDAEGNGHLLFGGATARINTATSDEFTESTITVLDLSSNQLSDVVVTAHGFSEITDSNGEVTLPLLQGGSEVSADDGVYGVSDILNPPNGVLQLPVIPTSGEWVIPTGVHAVLLDGNYFAPAGHNVTISTASSLTLRNADLSLSNGEIIIQGSGKLVGENGSTNAIVRTTGSHAIEGVGAGLTVMNDFYHSCSSDLHEWYGLHVQGDFYLEQTCSLNIYAGSINGNINPSMGGYVALSNAAQIRVVDFGMPVEGATVTVQGHQVLTNQDGIAIFSATYRNVTEVSDSSTGLLQVYILRNGHSQIRSWDPVNPTSIDVMMSSVSGGYLVEWLRLDAAFSPYYLDDNLTIMSGTTLTLLPYSSLTVKSNRGISVNGVLESSSATITGSDWNGITLSENGLVDMNGGQLIGAPLTSGPSLSEVSIDGMILSNAPLYVSGLGILDISNSLLHQSDYCINGNGGQVMVSHSIIQSCSHVGAMLTQSVVSFSNVTFGSDNEKGMHLRAASGVVTDIIGTSHNGDGPVIHIELVDSTLDVNNIEIKSGSNSAALLVEWSDMFVISDSIIHGAPGMLVDHSMFVISNVEFIGNGDGVALDIMGARAESSQINNCDFDNYDNSVHLVGEEGDLEMPPYIFTSNHHHSTTAYSSERLGFVSIGETIEGAIELNGIKMLSAEIWDPVSFDTSQVTILGSASLLFGSIWEIIVMGDSEPITDATIEVTTPTFGDVVPEQSVVANTSDGSASIPLIFQSWTSNGTSSTASATWRANAPTFIEGEGSFLPTQYSSRNVTATLVKNLNPIVNITQPNNGIEVQEGESVEFSALGQDLDSLMGDELSYVWYLRPQGDNPPGNQLFTGETGEVEYIGEVGVYIVTVVVTDAWGGISEDMVTITVVLDDADNDFIPSCSINGPNAWYDLVEDRYCGPDVYDTDDDNDNIPDDRDSFPTDPCAHSDFDMDGLPNSLLPNCETTLLEDDDDDNDGTLDNVDPNPLDPAISSLDNEGSSSGLFSPSVILPILILIIAVVIIFLRASRDEFGGEEIN